MLQPLEQLERGERVVRMVQERLGDRVLVPVEGRQVEGVIEGVAHAFEYGIVGDRTAAEAQARVGGDVPLFRGEETVDDDHGGDERGPDRPRGGGAGEGIQSAAASGGLARSAR